MNWDAEARRALDFSASFRGKCELIYWRQPGVQVIRGHDDVSDSMDSVLEIKGMCETTGVEMLGAAMSDDGLRWAVIVRGKDPHGYGADFMEGHIHAVWGMIVDFAVDRKQIKEYEARKELETREETTTDNAPDITYPGRFNIGPSDN